ncbi:hypothetical protein RRG08_042794 [Elysia crispata]|uniref:Uncharacterized protein n=1 Tax=Elysia crispata TaxID=231223 RepID=A0AAE0YD88_9GAST|nr:hypothetical protein RRG08_042794 [Elysia crispata]
MIAVGLCCQWFQEAHVNSCNSDVDEFTILLHNLNLCKTTSRQYCMRMRRSVGDDLWHRSLGFDHRLIHMGALVEVPITMSDSARPQVRLIQIIGGH